MLRYRRLASFFLSVFVAIIKVSLIFPWCGTVRRRAMKQAWSSRLLASLGLEVEISGELPSGKLLLVANHVSWLDIYLINALVPTAFVSKADVRHWPVIGWLAVRNDTIFLHRGSRGHAHLINGEIAKVLEEGCPVGVFPEGTTTEGHRLLHFHGALLQPALSVGATLVPLAIRYAEGDSESPCEAAAYAGDTTLGQSIWSIAGRRHLRAQLHVLPALAGQDRKVLAVDARQNIANALRITIT